MTRENEYLEKDANQSAEPKNHTSWLSEMLHNIQDIDYDFPLSGGEHAPQNIYHEAWENDEQMIAPLAEHIAKEEHHSSWYTQLLERIQDLDTDFPLSGGEHAHN